MNQPLSQLNDPRSLKDHQLALLSRAVFDIPPRTRHLLVIAGVIGIVLLTVECLVGRQEQTIGLDKVIHFSGYFVLSLTFVLALRPILFVPGLVCMGIRDISDGRSDGIKKVVSGNPSTYRPIEACSIWL